jgi:hypothetical protein
MAANGRIIRRTSPSPIRTSTLLLALGPGQGPDTVVAIGKNRVEWVVAV